MDGCSSNLVTISVFPSSAAKRRGDFLSSSVAFTSATFSIRISASSLSFSLMLLWRMFGKAVSLFLSAPLARRNFTVVFWLNSPFLSKLQLWLLTG